MLGLRKFQGRGTNNCFTIMAIQVGEVFPLLSAGEEQEVLWNGTAIAVV